MGDACWGKRPKREGQLEELVGDQNPGPEAPPRNRREGSKGKVRGGATTRGAVKKSRCVRIIEREEVRRDDPAKYFVPMGNGSTIPFEYQRG